MPASPREPDHLEYQGWLHVVPAVHGRASFAAAVRRAFAEVRPARLAVELPPALGPQLRRGIARLPSLSVLHHEGVTDSEEGLQRFLVPVDPCDAMIEALRLGLEHDLPVELVDLLVESYEPPLLQLPDPALASEVGAVAYARSLLPMQASLEPHPLDREREQLMAWRLGALRELGPVLFVCGCAHWQGVLHHLDHPGTPPVDDREPVALDLSHLSPRSAYALLGELPFVAARYERWRREHPPGEGEWSPGALVELLLERAERRFEHLWGEEVSRPTRRAIRRFAGKLAATGGSRVPGLYDLVVAAKGCQDDDLAGEVHDLAIRWPHQDNPDGLPELEVDLEQVRRHVKHVPFLRRRPDLFGRGRDPSEVFRRRPVEEEAGAWRRSWEQEELLGGCSYVPEDLRQLQWISHVRHEAPTYLEEQRTIYREFQGNLLDGIDIRETLRNWWRQQIVVREELRLRGAVGPVVVLYDDEPLPGPGRTCPDRYPHCIVWPGEAHDEGDLLLYSTEPGHRLSGPGISRCEYGGFASLPGVHLAWWQDPWIHLPRSGWVETKGEVLIVTAAACAQETYLALISPEPPRRAIRTRCERLGHPLIHIPAASFTPSTLRKLRIFHVLASTAVRARARDYIEPRPRGFRA